MVMLWWYLVMVSYSEWILKLHACHLMHHTMLKITKPLEYIVTQHQKEKKRKTVQTNNQEKKKIKRKKQKTPTTQQRTQRKKPKQKNKYIRTPTLRGQTRERREKHGGISGEPDNKGVCM